MRWSVRWLFAVAAAVCGVIVILKANGDSTLVFAGLGLVAAAVATVVP